MDSDENCLVVYLFRNDKNIIKQSYPAWPEEVYCPATQPSEGGGTDVLSRGYPSDMTGDNPPCLGVLPLPAPR